MPAISFERSLKLLLLILTLSSTVHSQSLRIPAFSLWHKQTSLDDGFSAMFPSKPTYSVEDQNFKDFNTKFHRYADRSKKGYYFEVGHAEYPPAIADKKLVFNTLVPMISNMLSKFNVQIDSRREIKTGSCSGEEIRATTGKGAIIKIRLFMSGQHLYQVSSGSDFPERISAKTIDFFLNSFLVTGGCNDRIAPTAAPSDEIERSVLEGTLDTASGWRRIISVRDGLEILVPNAAKLFQQDVSMGLALTSRTFLSSSGTEIYYVNVTGDFPPGFVRPTDKEMALKLFEQNLATEFASIHPTITVVRDLKLGAYWGREFKIKGDGRFGRAQVIMTAKKRYLIVASDSENNYAEGNITRFLTSIRISTN